MSNVKTEKVNFNLDGVWDDSFNTIEQFLEYLSNTYKNCSVKIDEADNNQCCIMSISAEDMNAAINFVVGVYGLDPIADHNDIMFYIQGE